MDPSLLEILHESIWVQIAKADFGSEAWEFESLRAYHLFSKEFPTR